MNLAYCYDLKWEYRDKAITTLAEFGFKPFELRHGSNLGYYLVVSIPEQYRKIFYSYKYMVFVDFEKIVNKIPRLMGKGRDV